MRTTEVAKFQTRVIQSTLQVKCISKRDSII